MPIPPEPQRRFRKTVALRCGLLTAAATAFSCARSGPAADVHLDALGRCIDERNGMVIEQNICYGAGGGYYRGTHYRYIPFHSAPYYSNPGSPGYLRPWSGASSASSSGTVRGFFGSSAHGAGA